MRLIDADAIKETIVKICGKCSNNITEYDENNVPNGNCAIWHILNMIDNAPTVELFCSYLSDGEVREPCVESPCEHERPQDNITEEDIQNAIKAGYENGYSMAQAKYQRPQGEWIEYKEGDEILYYCSNCHVTKGQAVNNYCACCGADMRGEQNV